MSSIFAVFNHKIGNRNLKVPNVVFVTASTVSMGGRESFGVKDIMALGTKLFNFQFCLATVTSPLSRTFPVLIDIPETGKG